MFFNFLGILTDPEAESGLYLAISSLDVQSLSKIHPLPYLWYTSIPIRIVSLALPKNPFISSPIKMGSQADRKTFSDSTISPLASVLLNISDVII